MSLASLPTLKPQAVFATLARVAAILLALVGDTCPQSVDEHRHGRCDQPRRSSPAASRDDGASGGTFRTSPLTRTSAGDVRSRVAVIVHTCPDQSRRSVRRRSLVARHVNDAMAVHRRRAVELVDGHLQDAPRSLAVASASPPEASSAHCVSHGGEDVELRQQLYHLPHDVVFGLQDAVVSLRPPSG